MKNDPSITIRVSSNHPNIEQIVAYHAACIAQQLNEPASTYVSDVEISVVRTERWHQPS